SAAAAAHRRRAGDLFRRPRPHGRRRRHRPPEAHGAGHRLRLPALGPAEAPPAAAACETEKRGPTMTPDMIRPWGYYAVGSVVFSGVMMFCQDVELRKISEKQLAAAVAEADRLLPGGWRWDDLQKRRRPVPPERNGALRLPELEKQIPSAWPGEDID